MVFILTLDDITLGEYADIETFIKNGIEDNMPELWLYCLDQ
jgi:hypothetical protein